jgi:hypothetical protein
MKRVQVFGDLSADATDDQYPTIVLCEECIADEEAKQEDSSIVTIVGDASPEDGPCEGCGADE